MKFLKYPLTLLYRIWFYILVLVPIIVLFPFILATILSEKTYPLFFKIARLWSKIILIGMGFNYSIEGDEVFEDGKSYFLTFESPKSIIYRIISSYELKPLSKKLATKPPFCPRFIKAFTSRKYGIPVSFSTM